MQIEITYRLIDKLSDLERVAKIRARLAYRKKYVWAALVLLAGIAFLMVGLTDSDPFYTSIGATFLLLTVFFVSRVLTNIKKLTAAFTKMGEDPGSITFIISDNGLTYRSKKASYNLEWTDFKSYLIYDGFIFLLTGKDLLTAFNIKVSYLTPAEFAELHTFLQNRLRQYKA